MSRGEHGLPIGAWVLIYDALGKCVARERLGPAGRLEVRNLKPGLYSLPVEAPGKRSTAKMAIE